MTFYSANWTEEDQRRANREAQRRYRQRKREEREAADALQQQASLAANLNLPTSGALNGKVQAKTGKPPKKAKLKIQSAYKGSPAQKMARWAEEKIVVPNGPLQGNPFIFDPWQMAFYEPALGPGIREAGQSVARKNGKSGGISVCLLAHLAGPLLVEGWRGLVVSETANLAKELRLSMEATAKKSRLEGIEFHKTPVPGVCYGLLDTRLDILAADKATGHALGVDMAIIDEAGLLGENKRDLWDAVMSALSGRDGRMLAISIQGDGPMFAELRARRDEPTVFWQEFVADPKLAYDDPVAWHQANPGLASGVKAISYMKDMSRRALLTPASAPNFASYDLNAPKDPTREMICTVKQWKDCEVSMEDLPERKGPCFLGIDLGGSASMTAAVGFWPESCLLQAWGAFPGTPDLRKRGQNDGVGGLYQRMFDRRELMIYPGRVTNVEEFIDDLASELAGEDIFALADRYRKAEMEDAMEASEVDWPIEWRGQGHSATADGSADVRGFQKGVLNRALKFGRSLLMESSITNSSIARDASGNPKLLRAHGRIDPLQAGVMSVAAGLRYLGRPVRQVFHGVA